MLARNHALLACGMVTEVQRSLRGRYDKRRDADLGPRSVVVI
jgi:hypothetical protein